jgi:predicted nucleic acid-binding protein
VFLDADVLIAGSASTTGASHLLLRLAEAGALEAVTSRQAVQEADRNLLAKLPAAVPAFRAILSSAVRVVADPSPRAAAGFAGQADTDDLPILAAADSSGCDYLEAISQPHYWKGLTK